MKYDVEVVTAYTFQVEANNQDEANEKAIKAAEVKPGIWYDWQVMDDGGRCECLEDFSDGTPFCQNCSLVR